MEIKELIKELSEAICIGHNKAALDIAKKHLNEYAEVTDFGASGVVGRINKGKEKTLLLDAHIDEVGFIVTSVFDDGFVKVAAVGGIDARILPSLRVIIHGKKDIPAVFTSTPPHLAKEESSVPSINEIFLDTGLFEDVNKIVSVGDFATYTSSVLPLSNSRLSGKSFDDRVAVACLIEVASRIYKKDIPYNVIISFTEQEELGTRGAITSGFSLECDEAITLDVSFAKAPGIPSEQSGTLGGGAMIGVSPILDKTITTSLIKVAEENNISFQKEVMGGKTGTDADSLSISKCGIPTGLLSIPLRNMHTSAEVIDLADIDSVCSLIEKYILSGGNVNA